MPALESGQTGGFSHLANRSQRKHGAPDDRARRLADGGHIRTSSTCLRTLATACTQAAGWPPVTAAAEDNVQTKCSKLVELAVFGTVRMVSTDAPMVGRF